MKTIIRALLKYLLLLYLIPYIVPGVEISGGFMTLLTGGLGLSVMFLILRPILHFISFPVNLITFGLFATVINAFILYLLTVFVSGITISPFVYRQTEIAGFVIPALSFNLFFAYIFTAFVLSCLDSFLNWLIK